MQNQKYWLLLAYWESEPSCDNLPRFLLQCIISTGIGYLLDELCAFMSLPQCLSLSLSDLKGCRTRRSSARFSCSLLTDIPLPSTRACVGYRSFYRVFPRQLVQLFHRVFLCSVHECERLNVMLCWRQLVLYRAVMLHQLKFVGCATWRKPERGEIRPDAASACNRAGFLRW